MTIDQILRAFEHFGLASLGDGYKFTIQQASLEHNDPWFELDPRILGVRDPDKKNLLIYSSCHGTQIQKCLADFHLDIMDRFYVHLLFTHRMNLNKVSGFDDFLLAMFRTADVIFWNEMGANFGDHSTIHFRKYTSPDAKIVSFVPPSMACWWPICPTFGEHGVRDYMAQGFKQEKIIEKFMAGTFYPWFGKRLSEQLDNVAYREKRHTVGISKFCAQHYLKHKLFFTLNHPTFTVVDYIVGNLVERAGLKKYDPDHSLEVDVNHCQWGDHFPETNYEFDYFKFDYPLRWPNDRGGTDFYLKEIKRICAAPPPVINPDDDP